MKSYVLVGNILIQHEGIGGVEKAYIIQKYARIDQARVFEAFMKTGYVPEGITIYELGAKHTHEECNARLAALKAPEAAPAAPEAAPAAVPDNSPAPEEKPGRSPLEALMDLPDKDLAENRTAAQNGEFHGLVQDIARAANKKPEDVKAMLVKTYFGEMRRTRELNYGQMERLINYAKSMAAAVSALK